MTDQTFPLPAKLRLGKCLALAAVPGISLILLGSPEFRGALSAVGDALTVPRSMTMLWGGIMLTAFLGLWCSMWQALKEDHPSLPTLLRDPNNPDFNRHDFKAKVSVAAAQTISALRPALMTYQQHIKVCTWILIAILVVVGGVTLTAPEMENSGRGTGLFNGFTIMIYMIALVSAIAAFIFFMFYRDEKSKVAKEIAILDEAAPAISAQ